MDKPSEEFLAWDHKLFCSTDNAVHLSKEYERHDEELKGEDFSKMFVNNVNTLLQGDESFSLYLDAKISPDGRGHATNVIDGGEQSFKTYIEVCNINNFDGSTLDFRNLSIGILEIVTSPTIVRLRFRNCNISRLTVSKPPQNDNEYLSTAPITLNLQDTNIGKLNFEGGTVSEFIMKKGFIIELNCPAPHETNPFSGNVIIQDVFIPASRRDYLPDGVEMLSSDITIDGINIPAIHTKYKYLNAQPFRNFRHHLKSLENTPMSNLFHSLELRAERMTDPLPNKTISYLYDLFSEYGSSILRPFLWLIGFWIASTSLFYFTDGLENICSKCNLYSGWREIFLETGWWPTLSKAMYQSLVNIANPLGIFGVKSFLVPKYGLLVVWSIVHSLFSVAFITLTIFSIRRRFKLQ